MAPHNLHRAYYTCQRVYQKYRLHVVGFIPVRYTARRDFSGRYAVFSQVKPIFAVENTGGEKGHMEYVVQGCSCLSAGGRYRTSSRRLYGAYRKLAGSFGYADTLRRRVYRG